MPRGRLAPSPTGYLHLGNARSFLLAWLQMRSVGGEIVLRIEDLDQARAVPDGARRIVQDLEWLGLDWDNELSPDFAQSNRMSIYRDTISSLKDRGRLYECFCSRRELREIASAPHGSAGDYYDGSCRRLTPEERLERRAAKEPALRFIVPAGTIVTFTDLVAGIVRDDLSRTTGDFIVARADGVPGYQLAVVLDDIAMGITHVLRGNDLLASTPRQILLHRTFNAEPPAYAHVPLILGADGTRLAKRHGSVSLAELRGAGVSAASIVGWLASSCGLRPTPAPCMPDDLVEGFNLASIVRSPTATDREIAFR
ncbi:MAG: tRNA glutamyl-Q(34) synthetase GluQRS [Bacteroidetes bacterium]|nr:tRNA glutamyl-Q(34) synthetase GluQRS [Bacteroidota bacterium]